MRNICIGPKKSFNYFSVSILGGKNEALIARIRSLKSTRFFNYLLLFDYFNIKEHFSKQNPGSDNFLF